MVIRGRDSLINCCVPCLAVALTAPRDMSKRVIRSALFPAFRKACSLQSSFSSATLSRFSAGRSGICAGA